MGMFNNKTGNNICLHQYLIFSISFIKFIWSFLFPFSTFLISRGQLRYPGFPDGSVGKESAYSAGNTGDASSVPQSGRSPGGFQYSCLGNFMVRGAWWATAQRVAKSRTWLSMSAREAPLTYPVRSRVPWETADGPWKYKKTRPLRILVQNASNALLCWRVWGPQCWEGV